LQNCEKRLSFVTSVSLSTWNDLVSTTQTLMKSDTSIFQKSVKKTQVSLTSDKNNRYIAWRPIYTSDHISLSSS